MQCILKMFIKNSYILKSYVSPGVREQGCAYVSVCISVTKQPNIHPLHTVIQCKCKSLLCFHMVFNCHTEHQAPTLPHTALRMRYSFD